MMNLKWLLTLLLLLALAACGGGGGGGGSSDNATTTVGDNNDGTDPNGESTGDDGGISGDSIDISKLNSVTTDLNQITYPNSYQKPTLDTSDVNADICNLDVGVVTFSRDWLGSYPLPEIKGAPLQSKISRGATIRDIMLDDNPSFIVGCQGNLKKEFVRILERFTVLGVEVVYIPQWHWMSKKDDESWYVVPAENTFGPLSDTNLQYFADLATARGMQLVMLNQIQGFVDDFESPAYVPEYTVENLAKWFEANQDFVAERSVFFESIGVDIWEVGCSVCLFAPYKARNQDEMDLYAQEYEKNIDTIKKNFSGKILIYDNLDIKQYPSLLGKIDVLATSLNVSTYSTTEMDDLSVDNVKAKFLDSNLYQIDQLQSIGKPILFSLGMQSRGNALTEPGYLEETGCTSEFGSLDAGNEKDICLQKEVNTDFSIQAIFMEAAMEFLNEQNFTKNPIVMVNDYWVTDSIIPTNVFPNISLSFRNKPAEGIVKAWFARE